MLLVEGASDSLALQAAGLAAVGRPDAAGGAGFLAALLADRPVIMVGENDLKPDGRQPGRGEGRAGLADRPGPR